MLDVLTERETTRSGFDELWIASRQVCLFFPVDDTR